MGAAVKSVICLILCAAGSLAFALDQGRAYSSSPEWKLMKTVRFNIYYPDNLAAAAIGAGSLAEKAYIKAVQKFNHELTEVLPIFVYPEETDIAPAVKKIYHEFLKYAVLVPLPQSGKIDAGLIQRQMTFAFEYNMLIKPDTGRALNRNACGVIPDWFLTELAATDSSGAGEALRQARDEGKAKEKSRYELLKRLHGMGKGKTSDSNTFQNKINGSESIFDFRDAVFTDYSLFADAHLQFVCNFAVFNGNVWTASAEAAACDILQIHNLAAAGGFVRSGSSGFSPWVDINYRFAKYKPVVSANVYWKGNMPMVKSTEYILQGGSLGDEFGGKAGVDFRFAKFFSASAKSGVFHHKLIGAGSSLVDFCANIALDIGQSRRFGISAKGVVDWMRSFNNDEINLCKTEVYFNWFNVFASLHKVSLNGFAGRIFGKGKAEMPFYAGGYILRGQGLGSIKATQIAGGSMEYALLFSGLRLPFSAGFAEPELAVFTDVCSTDTEGFAAEAGVGLRIVFFPICVFRLDFSLPVYKKPNGDYAINFALSISI